MANSAIYHKRDNAPQEFTLRRRDYALLFTARGWSVLLNPREKNAPTPIIFVNIVMFV